MSRFGADPQGFFNSIYTQTPPWEIGTPQPAMAALLADYPPAGPILDVGCGSGDLAIYLAQFGHQVLGVDFVDAAIANAREKARSLPTEVAQLVEFQVGDALTPSLLHREFGAVVDSGFYHLFDRDQCNRFIDELALILRPGGQYYLHAFAVDFQVSNVPREVTIEELQAAFTEDKGWYIKEVQAVEFLSRVAPPVPAICACMERISAKESQML